ncbi:MAG: D-alanyl-D-alanine carboxypeptidase [Acetobacteraceae bacterium]|nr:D-alanyl-D-alanine carboxypeptidase [Acetobacteraceae bacterium]
MKSLARALAVACGLAGIASLAVPPAHAQIGSDRYASIVMDARTGAVLSAANAEEPRHPASLTKMMSVYLAFEAIRTGRVRGSDLITVSSRAAAEPPARLGLVAGSQISINQAVMAMITKSANDASTALGEHLAGSEERFAQMMTQKARQLGMRGTVFRNANGLPDREQVTTARDMAILGRRLIYDFPEEYQLFSTPAFSFRGRTHYNHNRLLAAYDGADGIKTGYINDSGFNLVASAEREGTRVIAVVFGGATGRERDRHIMALMDSGFDRLGVREAGVRRPSLALVSTAQAAPVRTSQARQAQARAGSAPRSWAIQVGAFNSRADATRAAKDGAKAIGQPARPSVEQGNTRRRQIFRARVVNLTQADAQAACTALGRKRQPCMLIRPGEAPELAAAR